jgi:hypothetical protein
MPLPLSKEIEECRAHAAHCARQAKSTACADIPEDFRRLEQNWLQLARSYEVAQQIVRPSTQSDNRNDGNGSPQGSGLASPLKP